MHTIHDTPISTVHTCFNSAHLFKQCTPFMTHLFQQCTPISTVHTYFSSAHLFQQCTPFMTHIFMLPLQVCCSYCWSATRRRPCCFKSSWCVDYCLGTVGLQMKHPPTCSARCIHLMLATTFCYTTLQFSTVRACQI